MGASVLLVLASLWAPPVDVTAILGKLELWLDRQLSMAPDAGPVDAGARDAGAPEAGVPDAGPADAGVRDSGPPPGPVTGAFKVAGARLLDPNGNEFRMRGTNRTHIDSQAQGLGQTKSNTTRWIADPEPWIPYSADYVINALRDPSRGGTTTNGRAVQVPGFWQTTCKSDAALFEKEVSRWVADAAKYQAALGGVMVLNIANEAWSDENVWRDKYRDAVSRIRAAGWRGTVMVDAPGCGQNAMAVVRQGAAVLAADPDRNVMFSWHVYGGVFDSQGGIPRSFAEQQDLVPTMDALAATGLCVVVGEFGPGRNIGPSPTMMTPQRVIAQAEAHGFGWLTWSWDDWNGANESADDNGFGHVRQGNSSTNLTQWGAIAVDYWNRLATPASVF